MSTTKMNFNDFKEGQLVYYKPSENKLGAIFEIIDMSFVNTPSFIRSNNIGKQCITIGKENGEFSTLIDVYKFENLISVECLREQITNKLRSLHNHNPNDDNIRKWFEKANLCDDYNLREFLDFL